MPAFPGAEGAGSTTPGGRGGRVVWVTNLDDAGPGSLRAACNVKGPRTVVFGTGGYIDLKSDIELTEPFCTIAGQSAPGGGVCVRGAGLVISTHDVVIRHMRFRLGAIDPAKVDRFRDCVHIAGHTPPHDIVLDHCSLSWAVSRNLVTWSGAHDLTVQWCIISQPLRRPENDGRKYGGMGFLIGDDTKNITVHHCLLAHQYRRNPRLKHGVTAHLVNNVVYNWSDGGAMVMGDFAKDPRAAAVEANAINNWFQAGAETPDDAPIVRALTTARIYAAGNVANARWYESDLLAATKTAASASEPFPSRPVTTQPAEEAYRRVLAEAGATRPRRDATDERVVDSVRKSTGRYVGSEQDAGGWPDLDPGTAPLDTDRDGMPDAWETLHGLDPDKPSDTADPDHDGYTNLEEYLNGTDPSRRQGM
ncbi:MAG: pectate lyase [Planctomycetes bacterium]|nr:pectate lyase [Planctomycetota bacterium]